MKKRRLDELLVAQGYFADEAAALRAVLAHEVKVGDAYATSAAQKVSPDAALWVKGRKRYVSRGGFKLEAALNGFNQVVAGLRCLDAGASTGGFTDCLLQAGAAEVTCVDVGYGQLAWELREDSRVRVFERTNIKEVDPEAMGGHFDVIVADLSFIGLARLAPVFAGLAQQGTVFIGLIKPQFEAQSDETLGGVVSDPAVRERVIAEVKDALVRAGFRPTGTIASPLKGPAGNTEYLVHALFDPPGLRSDQ